MSPHISIKAEAVFEFFGFPITNSFLTTLIVIILFFFIARYYNFQLNKENKSLSFYALHGLFLGIYNMLTSVLHKNTNRFYTLLGAFFFFILMANWSGLIPGVGSILIKTSVHENQIKEELIVPVDEPVVHLEEEINGEIVVEKEHVAKLIPLLRGGTADLNSTIALALITVFMTQLYGFKFLGPVDHLKKYLDFRDPIMIMLGPLEVIQEFARIVSFSFRLYGNIFAGEVLLTIVPFLLPIAFSFVVAPMFFMEIFVGFVQALVFVMLSAVFLNMSISHH